MTTFPIARAGDKTLEIQGKMANRHGLIAGATGTGKTVTLRRMAEAFSSEGVPVFLVDVKGDLSGIAQAGAASGKVGERIAEFGLGEQWLQSFPVRFWDVYGETGIPVRVTVSEMGPLLLARLMNLNDTQEGLLNLVFKVADDKGWHILDLKDLRSMLKHVSDHASEYRTQYGNVSAASIGAIQRQLLTLENEGAEKFFGEPSLNLQDWMQTDNGFRMDWTQVPDSLWPQVKLVYEMFVDPASLGEGQPGRILAIEYVSGDRRLDALWFARLQISGKTILPHAPS